ncbi:hypothetical protein [Synechococcus sp. CCAP 1479/9]|uniref:hypothetical protein n=1 Tax=Synechococcus sp. CCAP 1479/9 TaxID=1221593 RepID=UPI001C2276BB|nr:hypothetical protein [Synechococcus sp. CCAP 1479/9]
MGANPDDLGAIQAAIAADAAWLQQLQAATTTGDLLQLLQLAGLTPAGAADPTGAGAGAPR